MLGKLRMFPLQQAKYQVAVGSPVLPVAHPEQPTVGIAFSKSPSILLSLLDSHDSKSTVPLKKKNSIFCKEAAALIFYAYILFLLKKIRGGDKKIQVLCPSI